MIFQGTYLRRWYRDDNLKYFGGSLPDDTDIIYAPHKGCIGTSDEEDVGPFILISPEYAIEGRMTHMALLHEMVHLKLLPYKRHGERFQVEMLRLAKLGAFKNLW